MPVVERLAKRLSTRTGVLQPQGSGFARVEAGLIRSGVSLQRYEPPFVEVLSLHGTTTTVQGRDLRVSETRCRATGR
jgi:hypothetical protein